MQTTIESLRLTGGRVLIEEQLQEGSVGVREGLITLQSGDLSTALDVTGYLVLPGIIDLHGDAFERHIAPRPSAPFPSAVGLRSVDLDAASNGVTTAWMAQSWSWEGGTRSPDFTENFLASVQDYRPQSLTDLRVQIRCETHMVDTYDRLIAAIRTYGVDYVIFNNHLDEAIAMAKNDSSHLAGWASRAGRSIPDHMALVHAAVARQSEVPRFLCNLATAFDNLGVRYGSHDDTDARTRDYYAIIGAKICEFPTRYEPAALAKASGDPVLMGAPNVARGGSQSGNVSAESLIREGLCHALVSDYHYPSLAMAAYRLVDRDVLDFAKAWAMISSMPAKIMGLSDRGQITEGHRADLVLVNGDTRQIEGTIAAGRWSHLSGALATRLSSKRASVAMAAE